jgi:hypothetical protein
MIPPRATPSKPNHVCKLIKSLYGLKQTSRRWCEKLTSFLLQHNNKQASSDHSLFIKSTSTSFTILLVYVDDVIISGNSMTEIKHICSTNYIQNKDLGQLKYFLGLEVARSKLGITLCQRMYCLDLLEDAGFLVSKPISTPSYPSCKLHQDLVHLIMTFLDIEY